MSEEGISEKEEIINPENKTENIPQETIQTPSFQPTKQIREIDIIAEKNKELRRLPKPPGKNLTFEQLKSWMKLLTPEMWSHVMVYFYRYKPVIIRQLVDPLAFKYIDIMSEYFDDDYVINRHGGGEYGFEVNDTDLPEKQSIAKGRMSISMTQHEPILNYLELDLGAKANIGYITYLKGKQILDNNGKPVMTPNTNISSGMGNATVDMVKEILGFVAKLNEDQRNQLKDKINTDNGGIGKGISEILLERMKQDDPSKNMTMMVSMLTAMKEMFPKVSNEGSNQVNELWNKLLMSQADSFNKMMELVKGAQQQIPVVANDPLAALDKVLEIKERLDGLGGSQGKVSWQDRAIDAGERVLLPILGQLVQAWAWNKANNTQTNAKATPGQPQPKGTEANKPKGSGANPFNNPNLLTMPQQSQDNMIAQTMAEQQNPNPNISTNINISVDQEIAQLIMSYGQMIANAITGGTPGWEFGYDISRVAGILPHNRLKQVGIDKVIEVAKQIPDFWNIVGGVGEDMVRQWLDEFINFEKFIKEQESRGDD